MSEPINLEKSNKPVENKGSWKAVLFIAVVVIALVVIIVGSVMHYASSRNSNNSITAADRGYPVLSAPNDYEPTPMSTMPPAVAACPSDQKSHDGLGEDEGDTFCFTAKQWTVYQNMVNGKQKAADHKFAEAFRSTGMSSVADRQGFAVDYKCNGTIYDENAASAAFSGKSSAGLLHGKVKNSSDFTALRNKICGYPMPTTPPPSTTTLLPPKCPPNTSDPACRELPPGASSPKGNPPTLEPKAPVPSAPATGDPLG